MMKKFAANKITRLALLSALSLIIFTIELQIPDLSPIPGVKLGLANIITVYAVYRCKPYEAALVLSVRIILGALITGNLTAVFYSLAGGALCLLGMIPLSKMILENRMFVCSIIGAALHNIGQVAMAVIITRTFAVVLYLPLLIVTGCIAGAFTGLCAQFLVKRLKNKF